MSIEREGFVRFLTSREAARELRIASRLVTKYIRQGRLPATKLGKDWRIDVRDLDAYLARQRKDLAAAAVQAPDPNQVRLTDTAAAAAAFTTTLGSSGFDPRETAELAKKFTLELDHLTGRPARG